MNNLIAITCLAVGLTAVQSSFAQYNTAPGLTYEVQVGLFSEKQDLESFNYPAHVKERKLENHKYQYTCGEFPSYHAASNYKFVLSAVGAKDSFVIAFIDKQQVNMEEAATYIKTFEEGVAEVEE